MVTLICNPQDLQKVKKALEKDDRNGGLGVLHVPTGRIYLIPFDDMGGHDKFVEYLGLPESECKGFGILQKPDNTFIPLNVSHLNGPRGQPGSMRMPDDLFQAVVQALQDAGL